MKSIYFLGLGALGAKYAASFYDYNSENIKIIVNQDRKEKYAAEGVFVNEKRYNFDYITGIENEIYPDFIFVAVKSNQLKEAIVDLIPFVGENTLIISLLNGISSERILADTFGWDKVINAVAYMDAVKVENRVTYGSIGKIIFGHIENKFQERLHSLSEYMNGAKIPNMVTDEIQDAQWAKYLVNVVANQLTFLLEFPYGAFKTNQHLDKLMDLLSEEVIVVGKAHGVQIGDKEVDRMKATLKIVDEKGKTSMLQDREAKRYSEVDEFSGEIIALGKQYGIATPYNELVYNMVKAVEEAY
ncbi:2-dehydropantoate 2-reductase [Empedobacter falsenii]